MARILLQREQQSLQERSCIDVVLLYNDMMMLSDLTKQILAKAGWTEKYSCPQLDKYMRLLTDAGYVVHDCARDFIHKFGGLEFVMPHRKVPHVLDSFHTLVDLAIDVQDSDAVRQWAERVKDTLCIVGEVHGRHMCMVMGSRGGVYAGDGLLLLKIADSGEQAIENLCTGRPEIKIE